MKNIFVISFVMLFSVFSYSQELPKLKLTPNGVLPIVVQTDSLKAADLYKKAINWVQETYKNPEMVLKVRIENEKIRINGFSENAWSYKSLGMAQIFSMEYSLEISFKDGKYRFEFIIGQFSQAGVKAPYNYIVFYKKNGEIKSVYSDAVISLEDTMNNLSSSFYNYVTGKTTKKDSNW